MSVSTVDDSRTRPAGAALSDLAEQIVARLSDRAAVQCRTLDVGVLGLPDQPGRVIVGTSAGGDEWAQSGSGYAGEDTGSTGRVTVRWYGGSIIVASTPGAPGPCPECLDRRWTVCRPMAERRILDDPHGSISTAWSAPGPHIGSLVANLVEVVLAAAPDGPSHPVWEISTDTTVINRYGLIRDSGCPICATPAMDTSEGARIELHPTPTSTPGATRSLSPHDLELPMEALANPVCGMLGGSAMRVYHATATAPVSGCLNLRSKYGLHEMWWSGHAENYHLSETLAALEGLERAAGQQPRRTGIARWATVTELREPHVEMETCGLYTREFYEHHSDKYISWDENPSVPWVWGWSLPSQRAVLVPEQVAYYLDHRPDHRNTVQECSNGCASGSSATEAVLHGLLELLERDAFLISWYSGGSPREIDLDTVAHPLVRQMRAQVDLMGFDLRCFDVRMDIPVPAVGAVAVRRDGGPGRLCFAGGASLEPADAVRAAVCEAASYVPGFPDRVQDARERVKQMVDDYRYVTELPHHALLFGMPEMADAAQHWLGQSEPAPLDDVYADWTRDHPPVTDLGQAVEEIVGMLAERGHDTVVVDQSTPEQQALGLCTVATVVPGLVPIDFGWERQRALTMPRTRWAPYEAGLAARPLTSDELHLVPHPFP